MEKKQEAEQVWKNFWLYNRRLKNKPEYLMGIEDFKLALKAEIEKQAKKRVSKRNASEANKYLVFTANDILSLIDEVKPIQK